MHYKSDISVGTLTEQSTNGTNYQQRQSGTSMTGGKGPVSPLNVCSGPRLGGTENGQFCTKVVKRGGGLTNG